jgi:hypothetical protein
MNALRFFETSETNHPTTPCHIPEDLNPQKHRCEQTIFITYAHYMEVKLRYVHANYCINIPNRLAPYRIQQNITVFFSSQGRSYFIKHVRKEDQSFE